MRQKVSSLFQHDDTWHGLVLDLKGKNIVGAEFLSDDSYESLIEILGVYPLGVSLKDRLGYLAYLSFPFGGRRKIGMVIREELADYFPFPLDDVYFDFQETGKGHVLAAAVPKTIVEGHTANTKTSLLTLDSLAALYALRWFKVFKERDFLFMHLDNGTASILAFENGHISAARQVVFSEQVNILRQVINDLHTGEDSHQKVCYTVSSQEDPDILQALMSSLPTLRLEFPVPDDHLKGQKLPSFCWPGIGAALLSVYSKDEINILIAPRGGSLERDKTSFVAGSAIALLSVIIACLSYVNLCMKDRALRSLAVEQMSAYRSVFPKSPPVKDIVKAFDERLKAIEGDVAGYRSSGGVSPLRLLSDISARIDQNIDVKIGEFSVETNEFILVGTTTSFASAERIKKLLEEVDGAKGVEIQSIDLIGGQVKFKIRGAL